MRTSLARRAESGPEAEGCLAAGLCCSGRESSCLSRGWRTDRTHGECYCDQACGTLRDCCYDYDQACPAVPCVVSEWSVWSGCSEPCKATVRVRQRRVLQEPQNGGEPCPPLQQTAGCAEYHNQHGHCLQSLVPALITTGAFLFFQVSTDHVMHICVMHSYCVEFELTSLTSACQHNIGPHTQWMQYLREGHQVCVECQPPALAAGQKHCSGDGEDIEQDRRVSLQWQAVGNPRCRGVWRRVRRRDSCSCPTVHSFLFI
uniref:SMB domain-containing protein n=1 Tax=Pygocentrus nattereri TaxID=42514 RepID=A0AAR2LM14_PYGNA